MKKSFSLALLTGLSLWSIAPQAQAAGLATYVLYDGSRSTLPNSANATASGQWLAYATTPSPFDVTPTVINGVGTNLNTTTKTNTAYGGYSNYNGCLTICTPTKFNSLFPTLNRAQGYTLRVDFKINSEAHASNDRAGFHMIAISEDKKGIELNFWTNEVWEQNDGSGGTTLFTHGTGNTSVSTTGSVRSYELAVLGDTYTLYINGSNALSGSIKDYSAFDHTTGGPGGAGLPYDPYETPSFISFGDNTSQARVNADITYASISVAVPFEFSPTSGFLLLGGLAGMHHVRKRMQKSKTSIIDSSLCNS